MFVYFICRGTCKRTSCVSIDLEKCIPRVGTYTEGSIDAALWYKVEVINSILVDCDLNVVSWTCEKNDVEKYRSRHNGDLTAEKVRKMFENKEQLFGENIELNPSLAELFETSETIFQNLSAEVFNRDGNVPTYKDLVKILHVYILPEVTFKHAHSHIVQEVLNSIEKEYENIEMLIKMSVQSKRNIEECLTKQRKYLLSEDGVSSILSNTSRDNDVIKLLLTHVDKNVRKLEDRLSVLTDKITPLRNATDEKSLNILAETRAERNIVSKEKEMIILAREELVNGMLQERPRGKSKKSTFRRSQSLRNERISDKLDKYEKKTAELDNLSNNIKQQINIKIRMSSIREAANLTLKEIHRDGSSYGYNRKKGSLEIEADLFDPTKKPKEWKTLKEHVNTFLQTNQFDFRSKHEQFCTRIKENCKAIKEKAKRDFLVNYGVLQAGRPAYSVGSTPVDDKESMRFSTRWLFGSLPKEDCESICKQISEHITEMADAIAVEIKDSNEILRSFHSQVYICYEEHISEELMPVLTQMYEQSFRSQCESLSIWIREYSATELDSINKTLKSLFPCTAEIVIYNRQLQNSAARIKRSTSLVGSFYGKLNEASSFVSDSLSRTWNFVLRHNRPAFSDPTPQTELQKLNEQLTFAFKAFFTAVREEDTAVSIFRKLRFLTEAVQSAQETGSELRNKNGQNSELCTDDILDILILLICRLDSQTLLKLYAHVNVILHLSPGFLEGNINEYSLITLRGAYQHLFEQQEMHATGTSWI